MFAKAKAGAGGEGSFDDPNRPEKWYALVQAVRDRVAGRRVIFVGEDDPQATNVYMLQDDPLLGSVRISVNNPNLNWWKYLFNWKYTFPNNPALVNWRENPDLEPKQTRTIPPRVLTAFLKITTLPELSQGDEGGARDMAKYVGWQVTVDGYVL